MFSDNSAIAPLRREHVATIEMNAECCRVRLHRVSGGFALIAELNDSSLVDNVRIGRILVDAFREAEMQTWLVCAIEFICLRKGQKILSEYII